MRAELGGALLALITTLLGVLMAAQHNERRSDPLLIDAAAGAKAPPVRPECTMEPPNIQKSDARRIA